MENYTFIKKYSYSNYTLRIIQFPSLLYDKYYVKKGDLNLNGKSV